MATSSESGKQALEAQLDDEYRALLARREHAGIEPHADAQGHAARPRIGLALSGGGIRSATYCLGVMRGLARNGLLAHFDYLSTVSGGGYAGALWGRLCAAHGVRKAQELFARDDTLLLWWLRRNGRYLTPAGARDFGMALATYLRAWVAIHIEFGMLMLLLGLVVIAPHWLYRATAVASQLPWDQWHSLWWPLALLWLLAVVPGAMSGYWAAREGESAQRRSDVAMAVFFALAALGSAGLALRHRGVHLADAVVPGLAALALASCAAGLVVGMVLTHARGAGKARNWLTRALRAGLLGGVVLTALGLLDRVSWTLMLHAPWQTHERDDWRATGLASVIVGASLVAIRSGLEPLLRGVNQAAQRPGSVQHWARRALNALGLVALGLLVLLWLVVVQTLIFDPRGEDLPIISSPVWRAILLLALALGWLLLTGGNTDMPNSASLHSFYRARLVRAYLSVGNAARARSRFPDPLGALAPRSSERIAKVGRVTEVIDGDDVALADYRPEAKGGPIHLVNVCINQTRDDHSGLYDADRKGRALVVSHRGFEVGIDESLGVAASEHRDAGTLGRWAGISGAAAAPGAGSYTSTGLALLLLFMGVRLGYWWRACPGARLPWRWRWLGKHKLLRGEGLARFVGTAEPWWYLSDGGHFENTGVYALFKREVEFIVVVDGGCDPDFTYGDLENLVRKARIDFDTEVRFYTSVQAAGLFTLPVSDLVILSPEELADHQTRRGALLARVTYRSGREGTLVVVKPCLHRSLELDLLAYAHRNSSFPQQGTGDQSFDEAQWESYHRLGVDMGTGFSAAWLAQLPHWQRLGKRHAAHPAALLRRTGDTAESPGRPWRESARSVAVSATIGLGATGSLLVPAWYIFDDFRKEQQRLEVEVAKTRDERAQRLKELRTDLRLIGEALPLDDRCLLKVSDKTAEQVDGLLQRIDEEGVADMGRAAQARIDGTLRLLKERCADFGTERALRPEACGAAPDRPLARERICEAIDSRREKEDAQREREAWENYWWRPDCPAGSQPCLKVRRLWAPVEVEALWCKLIGGERCDASGPYAAAPAAATSIGAAGRTASSPGAPGACARVGGERVRLFTQVYDETGRVAAQQWLDLVRRAEPQVSTPPIENVRRSAAIAGQRPMVPWRRPTMVVHRPGEWDCAQAIARALAPKAPLDTLRVRLLPNTLTPQPGVIELWLPPMEEEQTAGY
jgi:hypothetical protein